MSTVKNKSGLTEQEVQDGIDFADAAQYLAGGRASERGRDLAREVLRGNIDVNKAAAIRLDEIKSTGK